MTSYWHLSQTHLNILETCPPLFQKSYLQQLQSLPNLTREESKEWGNLFHLKMQQYYGGLSLDQILTNDQNLNESLKGLIFAVQDLAESSDIISKKAEYQVNYTLRNYFFTAIYDLIILYPNKALIFDWKTYLKPQNEKTLVNHWQTKLYLYILAENFNYKPEQISFTYWFVKLPNKTQKLVINYNQSKHDRTKQDLNNILDKLESLTYQYIENKINFPHHSKCQSCPHRHLFSELSNESDLEKSVPKSFDEIINSF
ncbi:PD-(D/E)XK nuclease family protein [Geminocystis sp. NIES-3709]|uniref:PD-(D/E)XK nuclease family protein n=1 Tax=Geminocystis sp. NIES-3709 TaxID=1617448 RepID=UPI0008263457|nr:PD-(D/E)XK nuclease family protein [Geminocystis sp. NIES-3709]